MDGPLYRLPRHIETRWASPENYDAERGAAAQTNYGRKGSPCLEVNAGDAFTMAHAEGSGTIRRIWITFSGHRKPELLRGLVLRAYWDGADKPAIEAPLGDFFGLALGRLAPFECAWFDNPEGRSFNCRLPMPFRTAFRMTVTNESPVSVDEFYYDVDFTLGDQHPEDVGYLHAFWNRENPTTLRRDFHVLPRVTGRGRYLGANFGVIADQETYDDSWWGEGEIKIYLDGDQDNHPTLSGTGTEDLIGTAYGQGQFAHQWQGCPIADWDRFQYAFYRLHGPDPVFFQQDVRVTIQQMGGAQNQLLLGYLRKHGVDHYVEAGDGTVLVTPDSLDAADPLGFTMIERVDDWCATAYFYLDRPVSDLSAIQPYDVRVAGLAADRG